MKTLHYNCFFKQVYIYSDVRVVCARNLNKMFCKNVNPDLFLYEGVKLRAKNRLSETDWGVWMIDFLHKQTFKNTLSLKISVIRLALLPFYFNWLKVLETPRTSDT